MVPQVLHVLNFHSNNERHQPTIRALDLVKRYADTKVHTFPAEEEVPLDGVVRGLWREAVIEEDAQGRQRVNWITYEICVLEALREQLRCKEIWVAGARSMLFLRLSTRTSLRSPANEDISSNLGRSALESQRASLGLL